jgi:hypothetical protein
VEEIELDPPKRGEVLVKLSASGLAETFDWRPYARDLIANAESLALAALAPLPVIVIAYLFARQAVERSAHA